jgi:hypothetical protein
MIKNIDNHPIVREHNWNEEELIHFVMKNLLSKFSKEFRRMIGYFLHGGLIIMLYLKEYHLIG